MEDRTRRSLSRSELRKFAWTMMGALTLVGVVGVWRNAQVVPSIVFAMAGLFLLSGLVMPERLEPVYTIWMKVAGILAWINTRIVLSVFYYLVLTPFSVVMRLVRKDVLRRRPDRAASTHWHPRAPMRSARQSYEHLY